MKKGASFDLYDNIPEDMRIYLQNYGFNFSKKMCDFAVSMMKTKEGKITPIPKEKYDELLKLYGIELEKDNGYNGLYVLHMAKADYWGTVISSEDQLAKFIKAYIDDPDYPSTEKAFRHFLADMYGFVVNAHVSIRLGVFAFYDSKPSSVHVRLVWSISLLEDFLIPQYLK